MKLYRVTAVNKATGNRVHVSSYKAGALCTVYDDPDTAKRAMIGFKARHHYSKLDDFRVESADVEWSGE